MQHAELRFQQGSSRHEQRLRLLRGDAAGLACQLAEQADVLLGRALHHPVAHVEDVPLPARLQQRLLHGAPDGGLAAEEHHGVHVALQKEAGTKQSHHAQVGLLACGGGPASRACSKRYKLDEKLDMRQTMKAEPKAETNLDGAVAAERPPRVGDVDRPVEADHVGGAALHRLQLAGACGSKESLLMSRIALLCLPCAQQTVAPAEAEAGAPRRW